MLETVRTVRSVELGVWSLELRVELWDVYFLRNNRIVVLSYYFSIKWLTPFYPAMESQVAGGDEKCMDYVFCGDAADRETAVS